MLGVQGRGVELRPRTPAPVRSWRSGRTVVVARVTRAEQAAFGPAEALRLANVGELAKEVESGLGERWLDAFVRIEHHTAAGDVAGRRLHLPQAGS